MSLAILRLTAQPNRVPAAHRLRSGVSQASAAAADEPEEEAIYAGVTRRLIRERGIAPDRLRRAS
jgi:hypothetical protein